MSTKRGCVLGETDLYSSCACMRGFSRVLADPQVLESQQAARVEGHQHFSAFHDVEAEGPGAENDPLGLHTQGQHHAVLVLGQERHAAVEGGNQRIISLSYLQNKSHISSVETQLLSCQHQLLVKGPGALNCTYRSTNPVYYFTYKARQMFAVAVK